jgi:predicted pyridoxine 5'-phosphate oxidase superfamily flavin-nucleotide-binding protein
MSDRGSPFHAGERAIQEREGVRERIEQVGQKIIRDHLPAQHREFFAQLPFLVAAGLDEAERPWATLLFGSPGFVDATDPRTLDVHALPRHGDPLVERFERGAPVGLLGIEFDTRRRNRANGTIADRSERGFRVAVTQSFGNCPQYIQARRILRPRNPSDRAPHSAIPEGRLLSKPAREAVTRADTFFIATASSAPRGGAASEGLDVSHRGGKPGFVRVDEEEGATVLTFPDFRGNFQFNTLGNLLVNPRAGVVFVDFASGDLLTLTGSGAIVWSGPELEGFDGAERLVRFRVDEGRLLEGAVPLEWSRDVELSPHLARTGAWPEPPRR